MRRHSVSGHGLPGSRRSRRGRTGRWAAGAVVAFTAACGLADGSDLDVAGPPTTATPATTTTVAPAVPSTYEEGPCPFDEPTDVEVTCGTLTVPRDRTHGDEATVDVAVARLSARSAEPEADPILYFEGGPGGASLVY